MGARDGHPSTRLSNGTLLAAGGPPVSSLFSPTRSSPTRRQALTATHACAAAGTCRKCYPRWLRDHRLRFDNEGELLQGSHVRSGRFDIAEAGETYSDAIVVGVGMAGLSAAYLVRPAREREGSGSRHPSRRPRKWAVEPRGPAVGRAPPTCGRNTVDTRALCGTPHPGPS